MIDDRHESIELYADLSPEVDRRRAAGEITREPMSNEELEKLLEQIAAKPD